MSGFAVGVLPPTLKGYNIEPENNEEALCNMMEYAVVSAEPCVWMRGCLSH